MNRILASEWRKLRATPTMWWLLAGVVLLGIAHTLAGLSVQNSGHTSLTSDLSLRDDLNAIGTGAVLVCIAGIIGMAGEFRFGQADQTFVSEPRRWPVLTAKLALFAAVGAVFGIVASAATLTTIWIWWAGHGATFDVGRSLIWLAVAGQVAAAVLFGALGVAVGAIARNQVAAIVATLVYLILFETIVMQASPTIGRWLPGEAADALRRMPASGLLSMGSGAAVLSVWIAAMIGLALWRTLRTDIA